MPVSAVATRTENGAALARDWGGRFVVFSALFLLAPLFRSLFAGPLPPFSALQSLLGLAFREDFGGDVLSIKGPQEGSGGTDRA